MGSPVLIYGPSSWKVVASRSAVVSDRPDVHKWTPFAFCPGGPEPSTGRDRSASASGTTHLDRLRRRSRDWLSKA